MEKAGKSEFVERNRDGKIRQLVIIRFLSVESNDKKYSYLIIFSPFTNEKKLIQGIVVILPRFTLKFYNNNLIQTLRISLQKRN